MRPPRSAARLAACALKEVPKRPSSEVGALRVLNVRPGDANKHTMTKAYARFGDIYSVHLGAPASGCADND